VRDDELQLTEHRITPSFKLCAGINVLPVHPEVKDAQGRVTQPAQAEQVLQVLRQAKERVAIAAVQFEYSVSP